MSEPTRRAAAPSTTAAFAVGVIVLQVIVAALAAFKLLGVTDASWWLITSPLWMAALGAWLLFAATFLGSMLLELGDRVGGRR